MNCLLASRQLAKLPLHVLCWQVSSIDPIQHSLPTGVSTRSDVNLDRHFSQLNDQVHKDINDEGDEPWQWKLEAVFSSWKLTQYEVYVHIIIWMFLFVRNKLKLLNWGVLYQKKYPRHSPFPGEVFHPSIFPLYPSLSVHLLWCIFVITLSFYSSSSLLWGKGAAASSSSVDSQSGQQPQEAK